MKRKKTRKTTGISRRAFLVGFTAIPVALAAPIAYSVIAGSVFRESGHAVPGIEVVLLPSKPSKKNKRQAVFSNGRGEFAFRVPVEEMEYSLIVKTDAYLPETKHVKIVGEERVEQNFLLERSPKKD